MSAERAFQNKGFYHHRIDYPKVVICSAFLLLQLKVKALIVQTPCVDLSRHILLMDVVKVRSMKAANRLTKADK